MTQSGSAGDLSRAARIATVAALGVIAAFIAGKAGRDAILLSNFDVTWLPLFVGISAVLSLPLVVVAGRVMARIGPGRLMPTLNVVSAVMLIGEWVLLGVEPRVAAVVTFFHLSSLGAVLVSGFWSIINERFDARSAKRHIGRIGLGATLGGIVGGLVAERSAVYLEPGAILLVLAGLQLACAVMMRLLAGPETDVHDIDAVQPGQAWSALRQVSKSRLLRNLGGLVVLGAVAAAALDYLFKAEVARSSGPDGPLRFFAIYHTVTNVITALVQLALARFVVTRFGVARSLGVLPGTVVAFGAGALIVPGLWSIVVARAAEMVTRSSLFRAAYELIFAPLSERDKRPTKIVLDVGAERLGDLIGSQIVGAIVLTIAMPQPWLLGCALVAGLGALAFARVMPRSYTAALEDSLLARGADAPEPSPEASMMWSTIGRPTLAEAGDLTAMSLLDLRAAGPPPAMTGRYKSIPPRAAPAASRASAPDLGGPQTVERDAIADLVAELRCGDATRVRIALASGISPQVAAHVVPLIGWDAIAPAAIRALRSIAPRCTGVLVDALVDPAQEFTIRRRLPGILDAGTPDLAWWGLWRGLADARFEVRYRCSRALSRMHKAGRGAPDGLDAVLAVIKRELSVGRDVWRSHNLLDGQEEAGGDQADDHGDESLLRKILHRRSSTGLDHVFTLLGLALPSEPVRIAAQGLFTDDRALRATALEYFESVLPGEVRDLLWPLIEVDASRLPAARPTEEIAAALMLSHPTIVANLRTVARREPQ